jgi:ABC-type oligopeptide transport system ATPase subunit
MLVEVRNLKTHFRIGRGQVVHAVDGVSLNIAENEILGLVGESGCGKSTLGKTLAGLQARTSGEILFRSQLLPERYTKQDFLKLSTDVQMIFQDPYASLNPRQERLSPVGCPVAGAGWSQARAHGPLPTRIFRRPAPAYRHCPCPDHQALLRDLR